MKKISIDNFIIIIAIISLFFTFTNYIPVSAIASLMLVFLPIYIYMRKLKVNKLTISVLVMFMLFTISTIIYDASALMKYEFYRRDGNVFVTFAPLLILPLVNNKINLEKLFNRFIKVATAITVILIVNYFIQYADIINEEHYLPEAFFMFYAHNAAGGYISTVLCLSIGIYMNNKKISNFIIVLINAFALFLSNSRGSIIGVAFALIILLCTYNPLKKIKIMKYADIIAFITTFIIIFTVSSLIMNKLGDSAIEVPKDEYTLPYELRDYDNMFAKIGRSYTIVNRTCYLWPRAVNLFIYSPIFGTGFGSYNDMPYDLETIIPNILTINKGEIHYSDSHAHNSYLHVLAETGILGFTILLIVLWYMRKVILNIENKTVRIALYLTFICIVFSAFTEHRLFTPSQVLPFTLLLGITLGNVENNNISKRS